VNAAELVVHGKSLASAVTDPILRKNVLGSIQDLHNSMGKVYSTARSKCFYYLFSNILAISGPNNPQLAQVLNQAAGSVEQSISKKLIFVVIITPCIEKIIDVAGQIAPTQIENYLSNAATDIEELAERELKQASNVITSAIQRLKRAQEEARFSFFLFYNNPISEPID
jgi:replicative DNA helicase